MKTSVIISTYNNPKWLEKVLWGYENQTFKDFEVVIADDGSDQPTINLIKEFKEESPLKIVHVWHERNGYQKCKILNKAIASATGTYLIFTDGDCVPRNDFVQEHINHARPGFYLSGGVVRIPRLASEQLTREDIATGRAFNLSFLKSMGLRSSYLKNLKLMLHGRWAEAMNKITTRRPTWNGGNSSGWKADLLAVNGFNETMEYGGQDVECGCRLINNGIKPLQLVYSLAAIHLDHDRGYKTNESVIRNKQIIRETRIQKIKWVDSGFDNSLSLG